MNRQLIIRPDAEVDIAQAFDWYNSRVPGLGEQFLLALDAAFNSVLRNPLIHPEVYKTVRRALTRRFPFAVFYLVEEAGVIVLSVCHVRRNPQAWKTRA